MLLFVFFSSVATGVLVYQTTSSTNITGPDKITINDISGSAYYKTFVSMKNGDATLLMQKDGITFERQDCNKSWS